ncbi:MAG: DUF445 domain-containing protein [Desulfurobacterium sp.]|nr:MAG: DUF445 domain-containing protein [Desulfurobacterium sp.]
MIELLIPPAFGALIGYFTNYVAIKMLFRPLKPYYIFGWKVPFTPGLIPSKREKLAEAIAKVVRENLLTEEVIRKRLNEEEIKRSLKSLAGRFIDELLLNGDVYVGEFLERIGDEELGNLVDFELVEEKVERAVEGILNRINGKSLEELLPSSLKKRFWSFIDEKTEEIASQLLNLSQSPEFKSLVYHSIRRGVERFKALVPVISDRMVDNISEKISLQVLRIVEEVAGSEELRFKVSKFVWAELQRLLSRPLDLSGEELKVTVREAVESLLYSLKGKRFSEVVNEAFITELFSVGKELLERRKDYLSEIVAEKLLRIIELELPVILESVDVESIVRERVNSLPIEEVEGIVLKLISEELRYITFFGGVLGFFIGLSQLFFQ